ncbi:hypothetical protein GCM10027160_23420 [Streptomyces calidiresistens]
MQANTVVTVLTAAAVDPFTGAAGGEEPAAVGVPAEIVETNRRTDDPVTGTPRTVRDTIALLPPDTPGVAPGARLLDETTGLIHPIREVHQHHPAGWTSDLVCTLHRLDPHHP